MVCGLKVGWGFTWIKNYNWMKHWCFRQKIKNISMTTLMSAHSLSSWLWRAHTLWIRNFFKLAIPEDALQTEQWRNFLFRTFSLCLREQYIREGELTERRQLVLRDGLGIGQWVVSCITCFSWIFSLHLLFISSISVFCFVSIMTLFLAQPMSFTFLFLIILLILLGKGGGLSACTVFSCWLGLTHDTLSCDPQQGTSTSLMAPSSFWKHISSGSTSLGEPK